LALLLASTLLLLALLALLLLAFLTLLLLASATSKSTNKPLSLVGYSSDGVLRSLHSLPGLVGHLACSVLRSSATTLGFGGAGFLDGLLSLGGRGDLQVEEAPVGAELQADEGAGFVLDGAGSLSLLVGGPLGALRAGKISDVAYYLLGDRVALLIDGLLYDVALFVDGALNGLPLFVGGGFTKKLGAGGDILGDLGGLVYRLPRRFLDLPCGLSCGVLDSLGGLTDLVGYALKGSALSLLALLVLLALAHLSSFWRNESDQLAL
jgi:hypothetical protein